MDSADVTGIWLPDEILLRILSSLEDSLPQSFNKDVKERKVFNKTLCNACLASKRLGRLAQTVLYRRIDARSRSLTITMLNSPHLCGMVRELYCPFQKKSANSFGLVSLRNFLRVLWNLKCTKHDPNWLKDTSLPGSNTSGTHTFSEPEVRGYRYDLVVSCWLYLLPSLKSITIGVANDMPVLPDLIRFYLEKMPHRLSQLATIDLRASSDDKLSFIEPALILFQLPFLKNVTIYDVAYVVASGNTGNIGRTFDTPAEACQKLEWVKADFTWITPESLKIMLSSCKSLRFLDIKIKTMSRTRCDPFRYHLGEWLQNCHALENLKIDIRASRRWTDGSEGSREIQEQTWVRENLGSLQGLTKLKRLSLTVEFQLLTMPRTKDLPFVPIPLSLDFVNILPTSIREFEVRKLSILDYDSFVDSVYRLAESERLTNLYSVVMFFGLELARDVKHLGWKVRVDGSFCFDMLHEGRRGWPEIPYQVKPSSTYTYRYGRV
ncbi:hypothetical protein F53441_9300 [Fusarium austroafricanum]|uniref:F-box domain-containing protein n=1 Tax=Fusarium austroafricanum TaxID=2364996 RepID=A0A8H4KBD0_9HYPO|nr:hypothetical protein F53441_9300 [Fusarium austroafricanum]